MLEDLIQTKVRVPPLRGRVIDRDRLSRRLDAAAQCKLILVTAPAGFGKTTLLAKWAADAGKPVAWLSLDREDNDPHTFCTYLVAAVQAAHGDLGIAAMEMLRSPSGIPVRAVVKALVNEILEKERVLTLVMDDFHLVENPEIHHILKFFIDYTPDHAHLVVATRTELPFSAGRLKVGGQFVQIDAEALRFTEAEAGLLFRRIMGNRFGEKEIAELTGRCEGWAAGLQIALLAAESDRTGLKIALPQMQAHIIDYFMDEVLGFQPPRIQAFLLDTAILGRLNPSLCNAVTGRKDSGAILKRLCAANMFVVALDQKPFWYRYHHMFAEALHARLLRERPDRVPVLHGRAAAWFQKKKMAGEAIHHAISARDWDLAGKLIARYAANAIMRGDSATALRWIRALPDGRITGSPFLCISYAYALFSSHLSKFSAMPFHAIEHFLCEAEKFLPGMLEAGGPESPAYKSLAAYVDALRVHLAYSRNEPREKVIALGVRTLEKFSKNNVFIRTNILFTLALTYLDTGDLEACSDCLEEGRSAAFIGGFCFQVILADSFRAFLARIRGRLRASEQICRSGLQSVQQAFVGTNRLSAEVLGYYDLHEAFLLLERNQPARAAALAEKAMESVRLLNETYTYLLGLQVLFFSRLFTGASEESVLAPLREMEDLSVYCGRARTLAGALRIRYLVCRFGREAEMFQRAFDLVEQYGLEAARPEEDKPHPVPFERLIRLGEQMNLMRLYLAESMARKRQQARMSAGALADRLEVMLADIRREGFGEMEIECLILLAIARSALGRDEPALLALKKAICLADSEGYLRIFVNEGDMLVPVLEKSIHAGICVDYAGRVLDIIRTGVLADFSSRQADLRAGPEKPLSRQERAVLQLIARGLSNQEIAERLCIALATVKTHNYNIFKKLNVSSRMAAVQKARSLDMHP